MPRDRFNLPLLVSVKQCQAELEGCDLIADLFSLRQANEPKSIQSDLVFTADELLPSLQNVVN